MGEGVLDENTIEVQLPGTPAVGMALLNAYKTTGSSIALNAAHDAAQALIIGQNTHGGWQHTIRFDRPAGNMVSFDDDEQAISFLIPPIRKWTTLCTINKALSLMKKPI